MKKCTIKNLPNELKAIFPESERTDLINQIISEAEAGEFHDYKNKKYVCGKVQLVEMLRNTRDVKTLLIAEAIMRGDYDEHADTEDIAMMKKDWIESGASEESFNRMMGK